jgi:hypothetical protein
LQLAIIGIRGRLSLRYGAQQEMVLKISLIGIEFYMFFFFFLNIHLYSIAGQAKVWSRFVAPGLDFPVLDK